jgi:hypothetical protein
MYIFYVRNKTPSSFDAQNLSVGKEKLIQEYRTRICMNLRGFYNNQYELNLTSGNALLILVHSVNWDIDHSSTSLNAWKFIKNSFYKETTIRYLLDHQNLPIIGKLFKKIVFGHISMVYDVTTTFMQGID